MRLYAGIQADWLIKALQARNIPNMEIIAKLGGTDANSKEFSFLSTDIYLQIFNWGAEQTNDCHLGLSIAQTMEPKDLGVFGDLIQSSATIGGLLRLVERYQAIFMRGMGFSFQIKDNVCQVNWNYWATNRQDTRQDVEFSLGALVKFLRHHVDTDWQPIQTFFRHSSEFHDDRITQHFGSQCGFNHPYDAITFDASILDTPLREGDPQLLHVMERQAEHLLNDMERQQDLIKTVRLLISIGRHNPSFSIEKLASQLHITSRTLRRHLTDHNTSYKALCDEIMLEFGKKYLLETNASITAIAQQLGFSEASAFTRSFKRALGLSPAHFRSAHQDS